MFWLNVYNISLWTFRTDLWEEMKRLILCCHALAKYSFSAGVHPKNNHETLISPTKWLRWKNKSYCDCSSYYQHFSVLMRKARNDKIALMLIICINLFNRSIVMNEQLSAYVVAELWLLLQTLFLSLVRFENTGTLSVETSAKSHHASRC